MGFQAETLKRARRQAGMSQNDLGLRVGKTERTIYNYEAGNTRPTGRVVALLERACGVTEGFFFAHESIRTGADMETGG